MKIIYLLSFVALILGMSACKKTTEYPDGGSWTIHGKNGTHTYKSIKSHVYTAGSFNLDAQTTIATSDSNYAEINVGFCAQRRPSQSDTFAVLDENTCNLYTPSTPSVTIGNGAYYQAAGSDNKKVYVTVVSSNRVNVSGTNIMMIQRYINGDRDTSYIDLDLKQTD